MAEVVAAACYDCAVAAPFCNAEYVFAGRCSTVLGVLVWNASRWSRYEAVYSCEWTQGVVVDEWYATTQ